ncbi:MAG: methyltransferase domain-containing protein [Candidatus Heimdallarchaeota archaeon]|nr:methyltransferase domain-containing protein [Candidatus Heimdallarchaeota archaeon]
MSHDNPKNDNIHFTDEIKLTLESLRVEGKILDIGGGGEATISQLEKDRVIAIDLRLAELEEIKRKIPSLESIMLTMDAKSMNFIGESFEVVTCFFLFMYMNKDDQNEVMKEIYRVLKPGGLVYIWGLVIPKKSEDVQKEIFAVKLEITLPDTVIKTGFGCKWNKEQDLDHFINIAKNNGFKIIKAQEIANNQCFTLILEK